ncbi:putative reverse transcriptase domain-containing protein [Tanacetum coccineum]
MSDSEHSTVTYTSVSFPVEDDSDIGSPGVDGPPIMPEDPYAYIMAAYEVPPSPDYIPGPKVPPSPDYIPGPEEPQSPPPLDFVPEYDPEEEPEEDDEDPEEDPTDYPANRDDDDDDEDEDKDEEEEEHLAPADFVPPVHRMTARISIRDEPSISTPPRRIRGRSSAAGAARQDRPTIARDDPYSIAREDLYGFVDMVDVPPRCSTSKELDYDITIQMLWSLRTRRSGASALISELQSADHRDRGVITELLASDHKRQVQLTKTLRLLKGLQTQMVEFRRQHGPAKGHLRSCWTYTHGLKRWSLFTASESKLYISCPQLNFATCTLQGNALTWWNSHVKTTTLEAAHAMPWKTLKKMMTDKYCPRGEIKKLEFEMWNLKVKGNNVVA